MKENKLVTCSSYVKVQPSIVGIQPVWSKKPRFDKDGRPVEHLNWNAMSCKIAAEGISKENKFYHRDQLAEVIEHNFLSRPSVSKKRKAAENVGKNL